MLPVYALRLGKDAESGIRKGFPWIYSGQYVDSSELLHVAPGSLVAIETARGEKLGTGYFNAASQISCRVLTLKNEPINEAFFMQRLSQALAKRAPIGVPYYRLVHSEADYLPGLTVDRFGDILVVQVATAGMELLQPVWLSALQTLLAPQTIVLRNDIGARKLEGLEQEVRVISPPPLRGRAGVGGEGRSGASASPTPHPTLPLKGGGLMVELEENGCIYLADLLQGQKTGWFYDQRDNRKMIADLAAGKTLLDVYSHSGGFGIVAAKAGAEVTLVDSSKLALSIAAQAAQKNNVTCESLQGDAPEAMQSLAKENRRFDIVLADPPAFVKNKKDIAAGMKGYAKVARHAAALVAPGGLLFMASCSHHASRGAFNNAVMEGVAQAGRQGEILKQTGAGLDHPRHPLLPQSEYLKGLLVRLN